MKLTVHYDKETKIELNVGCIPEMIYGDIDATRKSFEHFAELTFVTLQREGRGFPLVRYPDARSMMVGDIIEWEDLDICIFCDWSGWGFLYKRELDMFLSLPENIRRQTFDYIKQHLEN